MIVDFHCHYSPAFFRYREYTMDPDALLAELDRYEIARAVLSPAGEFAAYATAEGNREVAALARCEPSRFVPFAIVNPWGRTGAIDELRRAHEESGAPGLVLHPILQGFEANDPLVFPVVEAALEMRMIVYVTGGAPYLAMPYKIADLAGRYPEGRFVMGHAGWDFHFDVPYCLEACPNLWAETSKNGLANLEALARRFGPSRLLFGSDYPFSSYAGEIEKIRLLPGLDDAGRERIFAGNARELLGLGAGV
ncbi:MAG TPA: amidohydrolase family protein [Candidatus Solibacter sp.]|nr:amidohydrolase family protein [Candidatus Solibacter sp.]